MIPRILGYTSLYPAPWAPIHGIFVQELMRHLAGIVAVEMLVPESGWRRLLAGKAAMRFQEPRIDGEHRCLFWTIPQFFKASDARLMAYCSRGAFRAGLRGAPQLVHAHYAYPDAAAAAILARRAGLPLIVTCHGSDINVLAHDFKRRPQIIETLRQAAAVVAVSQALAGAISELGIEKKTIWTIPNGVDLSKFRPGDSLRARRILGLSEEGSLLLAVGRLEPVKGYDRLLRAMTMLPAHVELVLVGEGGQRTILERLAGSLGLDLRVRFAGRVPHRDLANYFHAADLLTISSHSEGWPTIIHEALACGTPVVAPAIGGIPEALAEPGLGVVTASNDPAHLAKGIMTALESVWDATALHSVAVRHDWNHVAQAYAELYRSILSASK